MRPIADANGKAIRDANNKFVMLPGRFQECKAVGWYIPEYGAAQISINLTNYHVTAMLIGIILGPLFEQYLARALRISQGDLSVLFSSTLGNVLWAFLVFSLALPLARSYFGKRDR